MARWACNGWHAITVNTNSAHVSAFHLFRHSQRIVATRPGIQVICWTELPVLMLSDLYPYLSVLYGCQFVILK